MTHIANIAAYRTPRQRVQQAAFDGDGATARLAEDALAFGSFDSLTDAMRAVLLDRPDCDGARLEAFGNQLARDGWQLQREDDPAL